MTLITSGMRPAAQVEQHEVNGKTMRLLVHRKGATRAFPPHHPLIPCGLPADRAACAHWRHHGHLLLRPHRRATSLSEMQTLS